MQLDIISLCKALFSEVNPIPVKEAMNLLGMNVGHCRLPLVPMEPCNKALLEKALKDYGLLK